MVQSNINSWITCSSGSGSLISPKEGSLNCEMVKPASNAAKLGCAKTVPNKITWSGYGPYLSASSLFYYWDGEKSGNWCVGMCARVTSVSV